MVGHSEELHMRPTSIFAATLLTALLFTATALAQEPSVAPPSRRSGVRLALQGRMDAMAYTVPTDVLGELRSVTPYATPGVRLIDGKLFVGLGLGFGSVDVTTCEDTCDDFESVSQSYFTLSPMVFFDVLQAGPASLYAGGWFSFAPISAATVEIRRGAMTTIVETEEATAIAVNLAVGIRGQIVEGLAIGTEWGWAFTSASNDGRETGPRDDTTLTQQGLFGTVMIEGSIGL